MDRFDRLLIEQIPRLRRYARALTGDVNRADDLVQDCLERAWSRRRLWVRKDRIAPWLFTIMHNLYINDLRRWQARPHLVPLEDAPEPATPDAGAAVHLTLREVDAALEHLSPDQREVVLLVGLEQLRYKDAARVLDVPIGTIMSRLARGRERLRELLEDRLSAGEQRRVK